MPRNPSITFHLLILQYIFVLCLLFFVAINILTYRFQRVQEMIDTRRLSQKN